MPLNPSQIDRLVRDVIDRLPRMESALADDLQRNLRALLEARLARMDLVSREEFEVQKAVLEKTRARLRELEQRLAVLENVADSNPHQES
ncbi:MAG: accessory factor UbiK family protein [Gammaproteobacteria bacterium]|nr:MAG: accessory factor UbiK family protein [Gammaproteobacteria bacterium]